MTYYLKQKDGHGKPVFNARHMYLACEPCRDAGKAASCNHNNNLLPSWSSPRKRKIINALMKGQEEILAQEIGGIASALHQKAFPKALMDRFRDLDAYELSKSCSYPHVFVAIDPNGAGKKSDFAIMSMVIHNGLHVIIGMESFPSKNAMENHGLIVSHCLRIREDYRFQNSRLIFILENNLALESDHITLMLKDNLTNYLVMSEKSENHHIGFHTNNEMKKLAVQNLHQLLTFQQLRLADEGTMISISMNYEKALMTLFEQLTNFSEIIKESELQKPKKYYNGKDAGKDDLMMTLLLATYWKTFFFTSNKYREDQVYY
jgi:hypothetical protein